MLSVMFRSALVLACGLAAASVAVRAQDPSGGVVAAPDSAQDVAPDVAVRADELERHVRWLASDELAGRATATAGARAAAAYLATVLERSGVEPAGDDGSYLQLVPLERWTRTATAELHVVTRDGEQISALDGIEFLMRGPGPSTAALPVVSVGPDEALDELASPSVCLFLDASRTDALERLEAAGHPDGLGFGLVLVPGRPSDGGRARDPGDGEPGRLARRIDGPAPPALLRANGALLERLRAGEVASVALDAGREREELSCNNVVGRVPGSGALASEAVVLSAHYDHLGTREVQEGAGGGAGAAQEVDLIFNGADDDASGCAAVLELAGAIGATENPRRSVIVLLATGEENGLLGTEFYLDQPAWPLDDTVLNLNFEMIGRPDASVGGPGRLWLTGWERSNLGQALVAAGIDIAPDARPEHRFFERSDNYAFALRGIVAQTLSSYDLHQDYHTVADEADRLDYEHMEEALQPVLKALELALGSDLQPAWLPGGDPSAR